MLDFDEMPKNFINNCKIKIKNTLLNSILFKIFLELDIYLFKDYPFYI